MDLFCGAGGMTYGLNASGIPVISGIDLDPSCRYPYESNNHTPFIQANMTNVEARDVSALYPRGVIRVLAGCPPCQPFSTHTQKDKDRSKRSAWGLLDEFSRVVHYLKTRYRDPRERTSFDASRYI